MAGALVGAILVPSASACVQPANEELPRRGTIGAGVGPASGGGVQITALRPDGPAAKAGLRTSDVLKSVAGLAVSTPDDLTLALRSAGSGKPVQLELSRDGQAVTMSVAPDSLGAEQPPEGSTLRYDSVRVPAGYRLRTIITEPNGAAGKVPAFLFVQGIYCASLDRPQSPDAVDTRLVHDMARAGYVTLRVDKPGVGDSEGPPCGDIDFQTELAGYIEALKQLKGLPGVDPDRVYIFGHSMGGVMAPYLTKEVPVRGAIVYGTLARTWLEYSLENTRRQSKLMGADEAQANEMVQVQSRVLAPILIEKKSLGDVWTAHPELKQDDPMLEPTRMYSRHMSFYHQLQDLNLAAAWAEADTNVLAIHGEYDWVVSREDHDLIAAIADGRSGRKARSTTLPKTDHAFTTHASLTASVGAMGRGEWDGQLPKAVLAWIDEIEGRTTGAAPKLSAGETPPPQGAPPSASGRASLAASESSWKKFTTEAYRGKQDDVFFINPRTGWYVNGAGKIFKTTDAGATWAQKLHKPGTYFRCIAFVDERIGFAGNIGPGYFPNVTDTVPLYRTDDGGDSWNPVTSIEGPPIVGLCALEVLREQFVNAGNLDTRTRIIGVGRVGGPSAMIFSDDLGKSWSQVDIKTHAAMAFDVHFFDRDHGVIAAGSDADVANSRALILTTADGGKTWARAFESSRPYEITWKVSFPTREIGFVTIQSYNPDPSASQRFLAKTTDGGKTWSEIPLVSDHAVREFGVAFIDANRGWVGAMPGGFETSDGGRSWRRTEFGNAVNKIRVLRDRSTVLLHAIGVDVHVLTVESGT